MKTATDKFSKELKVPKKPKQISSFKKLHEKGVFVECPCCNTKHNQIYKRKIYKSLVKALKVLADKNHELDAASVGDFTKLRHWGLIQSLGTDGSWDVTSDGLNFLSGRLEVPEYLFIQNNIVIGKSDETVFIKDVV